MATRPEKIVCVECNGSMSHFPDLPNGQAESRTHYGFVQLTEIAVNNGTSTITKLRSFCGFRCLIVNLKKTDK